MYVYNLHVCPNFQSSFTHLGYRPKVPEVSTAAGLISLMKQEKELRGIGSDTDGLAKLAVPVKGAKEKKEKKGKRKAQACC